MNKIEFTREVQSHYPSATVDVDNDEQIIVYTGLFMKGDTVVERFTISSNHFSTDQQAEDALDWLCTYAPDACPGSAKAFP